MHDHDAHKENIFFAAAVFIESPVEENTTNFIESPMEENTTHRC